MEVFLCKIINTEVITRGTLKRKCFPVYFGKHFRTTFLQNTSEKLLLYVLEAVQKYLHDMCNFTKKDFATLYNVANIGRCKKHQLLMKQILQLTIPRKTKIWENC